MVVERPSYFMDTIVFIFVWLQTFAALTTCCPAGGSIFEGHCYWLVTEELDADAASDRCAQGNVISPGMLVVFDSPAVTSFVVDQLTSGQPNGLKFHIGLRRYPSEDNEFRWSDGQQLTWSNWHSGSPKDKKDCVVSARNQDGTWTSHNCSKSLSSVCQTVASCEPPCQQTVYEADGSIAKNQGGIYLQVTHEGQCAVGPSHHEYSNVSLVACATKCVGSSECGSLNFRYIDGDILGTCQLFNGAPTVATEDNCSYFTMP